MIVQEGNAPHWPNRARDLVAELFRKSAAAGGSKQGVRAPT